MKLTNNHILILSGALLICVIGLALGFSYLILLAMAGYCLWLIHQQNLLNIREREAEIKNRETDADFRSVAVSKIGVLAWNRGNLSFWTRNPDSRIGTRDLPENSLPENETRPPVLPIIMDAPCVLLWGGRERGKTNLARFVMQARSQKEDVLIIDPKETAHQTWPGYRIAGASYNYDEILDALAWVSRLGKHKITVLIDEMTLLKMKIPDFAEHWLQPLIEGRERGQSIWVVGQSKTAKSLGLSGMYDVLGSFDFVVGCFFKKSTGERWILLEEEGEPKKICAQPPAFKTVSVSGCQSGFKAPFQQSGGESWDTATQDTQPDTGEEEVCQHSDVIRYITYDTLHTSPDMTPEERNIISTYQDMLVSQGKVSYNQIALKVFKTKGGRQTGDIKAVLRKYGLID